VKDIRKGPAGSAPQALTRVGGRLFFTANDGVHGRELWVSDGTGSGTRLVKDLTMGPKGTWTMGIIGVGNTAYFDIVYDGLYRTDGTAKGTRRVHGFAGVGLSDAVVRASRLYFPAEGPHARTTTVASPSWAMTLWKTDGTNTGTKRLAPKDLGVAGLVKHQGRIYFEAAAHSPTGLDVPSVLWRSDGTRAGTKQLSSVYVDPASGLVRMDSALWFDGSTSPYLESIRLYRSDGTKAGTGPVRPRVGNLRDMSPVVGQLWAHRRSPGVHDPDELWVSDGTAAGTGLVYGGAGDWFVGDWGDWESVGMDGLVYFPAGPGGASPGGASHGGVLVDNELWSSDGTTAGTVESVDVNPSGSSDPRDLIRLGDAILFTAADGQRGRELWRLDE
jgi:ELWxxDGT repeat protein